MHALTLLNPGRLSDWPSHVTHLPGHRLKEEVVVFFWRNCSTDPSAFHFSLGSAVRNLHWPLWFFSDNNHQPCNHITEIIQAPGCTPLIHSLFNLLLCYFIFSSAPSHKKGLKADFVLGVWGKKKALNTPALSMLSIKVLSLPFDKGLVFFVFFLISRFAEPPSSLLNFIYIVYSLRYIYLSINR